MTSWLGVGRTLWLVIVLPFALLITAVMGLTTWVSLIQGRSSVDELAVELNERITTGITEHVRSFAHTPFLFLKVVAAPYVAGEQKLDDYRKLQRSLLHQLKLAKGVDALYYANESGHFVLVKAGPQNIVYVRDESTEPYRYFYELDDSGNRVKLIKTQEYDPRTRPWYQAAAEAGRPAWSPVYPFAAEPVLGVTPSIPIYDELGKLRGVFGADLTLSSIAGFLRGLEISPNGQAFIIERSGAVIASSSSEPPFLETDNGRERLNATDSRSPIIRATASALISEFGSLADIANERRTYEFDGENHYVQITALEDEHDLDWLLVAVIPESDFMAHVNANTRFSLLFSLAALLVAIALGVVTARWISRPIMRVTHASRALVEGRLDHHVEVDSVEEVKALGEAFNQMAQHVKTSFHDLEEANKELEHRVQHRTVTLEQQMQREQALVDELDAANRKLEQLATLDGLTRIANRIRFDAHLDREWARVAREKDELSLIICDIDHFKQYNDTNGHVAGDECLRAVAGAIEAAVQRPSDFVARYGGEEFAIILPNTGMEGALRVAKAIHASVRSLKIRHPESTLSGGLVTLSLGVAAMRPSPSSSPLRLVERADGALYGAKQRGRDRIACATEQSHTMESIDVPD
jgi:diguanylate cyclase (GGDEF)-like protein